MTCLPEAFRLSSSSVYIKLDFFFFFLHSITFKISRSPTFKKFNHVPVVHPCISVKVRIHQLDQKIVFQTGFAYADADRICLVNL